jgi:hypothetical protein
MGEQRAGAQLSNFGGDLAKARSQVDQAHAAIHAMKSDVVSNHNRHKLRLMLTGNEPMVAMAGGGNAVKALIKAAKALDLPPAAASQRTQIPGTEPTYRKAKEILDREMPSGRTLDYGSGLGIGSRVLGSESFEPFPREGVAPTYTRAEDIPSDAFHRLVNLNMLNVVPRDVRDAAVENIGRVMRPGGMGLVTTRGKDVMKASGELGPEPNSMITSIGTYQKGFTPEELREYLQYILGNKYDIGRLNLGPAGAVVRKKGMKEGGEVHAANGLPLTFAYDKPDPDALQNWMRERQFGKVDIPAPYKVKPEEVTVARAMKAAPAAPVDEVTQGEYGPRERLRELLQKGLGKGMSKSGAARSADILTDAASFVAPPMWGYEGGQSLGRAYDAAKQGDYGTAAIEGGLGALNLLPALPGAKVLAKATEGMPAGLAIKPVGGQFLNKGFENRIIEMRRRDEPYPGEFDIKRNLVDRYRKEYEADPTEFNLRSKERAESELADVENKVAVNRWMDTNLQNYGRKYLGTKEDPVLKLAEQGILHMPYERAGVLSDVARQREAAGFPGEGTATTDLGQMWENMTDREIRQIAAGKITDPNYLTDMSHKMGSEALGKLPESVTPLEAAQVRAFRHLRGSGREDALENNPWLEKVDPNTPVYDVNSYSLGSKLGFDHVIDVLKEDLAAGRLRADQLPKMSVEQAVRRTAAYDAERAAAMEKASVEEMKGMTIAKEFDDGYKMVQLDKPGQFAKESDRMGHSVRGYEPSKSHEDWSEASGNSGHSTYGHGGWDSIKGGEAQVFSLRDAKNNPHVTIEVGKPDLNPMHWLFNLPEEQATNILAQMPTGASLDRTANFVRNLPEFQEARKAQKGVITQIKGKQNAAPKDDYQPMIQKFIREGGYTVEGDLRNADMVDTTSPNFSYRREKGDLPNNVPRYVTMSEWERLQRTGEFTPDQHFGEGGMKRGGRVKLGALSLAH